MNPPQKPTALARNLIYQSRWVNLYLDRVQFPNGNIIEQHHLLDFERPSVVVIAQDEQQRYVMVQVSRYPTGRAEWEFPAGGMEAGEDMRVAAARELLEETGCRAEDAQLLYEYNPLNGIANQVTYVVRCRAAEQGLIFDQQEISAVRWVTESEVWAMIRSGEMKDGLSLIAFLLHLGLG